MRERDGEDGQFGVDFKVLSIERLLEVQKTEIDHVAGIVGIKVRHLAPSYRGDADYLRCSNRKLRFS